LKKTDFVDKKYTVYQTQADVDSIYKKINFLNAGFSGAFLFLTGFAIASSSYVFTSLCGSITLLSTYTLYRNLQVSSYRVKSLHLHEDGQTIELKTNSSTLVTDISNILPLEDYLKTKFPNVNNLSYETMPLYYLFINNSLFVMSRGFAEFDKKALKSILYGKKIQIKH
jgi:hypothetical protein